MVELKKIFLELFVNTQKQMYQYIEPFLPKIGVAIIIFAVGWICAVLAKKIVRKLLRALGLDIVSEKTGLKRFLERGGITKSPSALIGRAFFWIIIVSAVVTVFHTINIKFAPQLLKEVNIYIPRVCIAIVLLIVGVLLGQFVGTFVKTTSRLANVGFHAVLGRITRYIIVGLAVMLALEQLGVSTAIILQLFLIIFGVMPFALALILGFGGRDIVAGALAGRMLRRIYTEGEEIESSSFSGEIESIDFITTRLKAGSGDIIVPNSELIKTVVKKQKKA